MTGENELPFAKFFVIPIPNLIDKSVAGKRVIRRLYDEREWRFIPSNPKYIDFAGFDEDEIKNIRLDC
jgi:hypothetical protein